MDWDKIASTQEYDGNPMDAIFPKKRQTRKRKQKEAENHLKKLILKPLPSSDTQEESPDPFNQTATQRTDSQEPFVFTNSNIFRTKDPPSALFRKYFPAHLLQFTDEELLEINELYVALQAEQEGQLTPANVSDTEHSCLIERFLQDAEANRLANSSIQSPSFVLDLTSSESP